MRYENFDLWIDAGIEGRYPVRAASPLGEVRESLSLDPGWCEIRPFQDRLAEREIDQAGLTDLGSRLYRWLFAGDIELLFERSAGRFLGEAERGLRVRLRIEAPELIALPWEFLYCLGSFFIGRTGIAFWGRRCNVPWSDIWKFSRRSRIWKCRYLSACWSLSPTVRTSM